MRSKQKANILGRKHLSHECRTVVSSPLHNLLAGTLSRRAFIERDIFRSREKTKHLYRKRTLCILGMYSNQRTQYSNRTQRTFL